MFFEGWERNSFHHPVAIPHPPPKEKGRTIHRTKLLSGRQLSPGVGEGQSRGTKWALAGEHRFSACGRVTLKFLTVANLQAGQ